MGDWLPAPPPILYGPIYSITPVMHLGGVHTGYNLLATGSVNGLLTNYHYREPGDRPLSDQWIPFETLPAAGEYIVVEQTVSFRAGGPYYSGTTRVDQRVKVGPLPSQLPPVDIKSPIHTCSDYIQLGGLIPGAWVYVQIEGGPMLVAAQARKGTENMFLLSVSVDLTGGKYILVWQGVNEKGDPRGEVKLRSNPTRSVIGVSKFKNPLVPPGFSETPRTCYNEIYLSSMLDGAQSGVSAPDDGQSFAAINSDAERWKFEGWLPRAVGSGSPGIAEANQFFARCKLESPTSKSPPIIKTTKLEIPKVETPLCERRTTIEITNLAPGNSLLIESRVNGIPSPARDNQMWAQIIAGSSYISDSGEVAPK